MADDSQIKTKRKTHPTQNDLRTCVQNILCGCVLNIPLNLSISDGLIQYLIWQFHDQSMQFLHHLTAIQMHCSFHLPVQVY